VTTRSAVPIERIGRLTQRVGTLLLAALAFIPAVASAPGRVPADTKLYLYLNPGRLLADALWSWDDRQFAGWVPHQTIGYLWPSGPWFWTFQHLGVPDWVAHRLWIGTILVVAGLGARWCARTLGLTPRGALVAAVVYQLSPFVLPYISRTSVLLLPWAGLGWLVGLTVRAARQGGWRWPALFALVVATVGGINATAMAMIAPAPLLWLADAALRRELPWRRALGVALRLGVLSVVVSLWWLVALAVQASFGAPVLNYTETLQSVSFTANSTEALRGLGYWLFYVRDPTGPLTTMSVHYQLSTFVMACGFVVILAGLAGLVLTRWRGRRFAAFAVLVGVVLAVGAHPIDDPSPLGSPLAHSARSTLTLALRSSTRAVPLAVLGLALGAGAIVGAVERIRPRWATLGALGVMLFALLDLPAAIHHQFVDPVLDHPQEMPLAWREVGAALDSLPAGSRTLQLPGTESAVARWGQTVDPVLPGLTKRSVMQRDWLPLGSAPAMDLFYALDDRFQAGTLEPSSIAPVARLFGADSIVYAGDVAFDRFRTARPEPTWAMYSGSVPGLGAPRTFGPELVNTPAVPMVDDRAVADPRIGTEVPQTALVPVVDAAPMVRADVTSTLVVGDGAGIVAAAGAGLIDGDGALRSAAALDDAALDEAEHDASRVILTDSNRKQAHHWRGSQDVLGYVEGVGDSVLADDAADHRLPVFPAQTTDDQTVSVQDGPVTASASAYGEPTAYRPEDRAAHAIDGDLSTAWRVGDRAEVVGEHLRLDLGTSRAVHEITVVQLPAQAAGRRISSLRITTDDRTLTVGLDDSSTTEAGQQIVLDSTTSTIDLAIAASDTGKLLNYAGFGPVGLREVRVDDLGPTTERLRLPLRGADVPASTALDIVLERWRTDPTNRWRSDPEATLARSFTLGSARELTPDISARIDARAPDAVLDALFGLPAGLTSSSRLAGSLASGPWAALDGDPATAWTSAFGAGLGASITIPLPAESTVSSLAGTVVDDPEHSRPTQLTVSVGGQRRVVELDTSSPSFDTSFAPMTGASMTVQVTATADRFTLDRRFGELVALPVAFGDLSGPAILRVALPAAIDSGCRSDLVRFDGNGPAFRFRGPTASLLAGDPVRLEACSTEPLSMAAGVHEVDSTSGATTAIDVDRVVLTSAGAADAAASPAAPGGTTAPAGGPGSAPASATVIDTGRGSRTIEVGPCPDGCWLVTGDGWNTGWSATLDGRALAPPESLDGGFNGWHIAPSTTAQRVELTWTPQRRIWVGLGVSIVAVLGCLLIVAVSHRRRRAWVPAPAPVLAAPWAGAGRSVATVVLAAVLAGLVIAPGWGLATALLAAVVSLVFGRPRLLGVAAMAVVTVVAVFYVLHQRSGRYLPGFGWVVNIESTHRWTLLALVLLAAASWNDREAEASEAAPLPSASK